ncbi:phosphatidylglycerol lysyltransferase domain-containing protein [soil metagenome]
MLPQYPEFTKLTIEHKSLIADFTGQFESYSDFNFTSLFAWDTDGSTSVSWLQGNLVIRLPDYMTAEPILSLLGVNNTDEVIRVLLKDHGPMKLVPRVVVEDIKELSTFDIQEERDHFDYIYSTSHITHLEGREYKKKRNKIQSVLQSHSKTLTSEYTSSLTSTLGKEIMEVFDIWSISKKPKEAQSEYLDGDYTAERLALQRLLTHADQLDLRFTLIRDAGRLVAFSINERINSKTAICHFEKALDVHPQFSSYVAVEAVKDLWALGCKYVNWEQDLGIAGLRQSKQSFQPIELLKKYSISTGVSGDELNK